MSTIRMDSFLSGLVARMWPAGAEVAGAFVEVGGRYLAFRSGWRSGWGGVKGPLARRNRRDG